MLIKLLVSVFERAKAKLISTHRRTAESHPDVDEWDFSPTNPTGLFVVEQPTRSTFSKWLCTTPAPAERSSGLIKSAKVRRSSSWRSLKERTNHPFEQINSRTLSVDQIHRNGKKQQQQKNNLLKKKSPSSQRADFLQSTLVHFPSPRQSVQPIRLSNCDESPRLSSYPKSSSTFHPYSDRSQHGQISHKSQFLNRSSGQNTSSGGADSGYSEDSFQMTRNSSERRLLHTSCPHCHCEQRSSTLNINRTSIKNLSSESSMSDLHLDKDLSYSTGKTSLATSRSYPHIKPLPRTKLPSQIHQSSLESPEQRRPRTLTAKRRRRQAQRRHLSCDSSLIPKQAAPTQQQAIPLRSSPVLRSPTIDQTSQRRHFTTGGLIDRPRKQWKSPAPLPKTSHIFGELNLEAIELDSIKTIDYHRPSFSSSYSSTSSLTSSSSSLHADKQSRKSRQSKHKSSKGKSTFLVWHEYQNPSLLSATHGTKLFSVVRGDQVKLLRRIGKSMLLVEKQGDGSIGFLPQSCLADDQIHSFLSVKGLRETVL